MSQVTSLWSIPFAYVFITKTVYSIYESLSCGYTLKSWWNFQRMQIIRRTTAFFFGFTDVIIKHLGLSPRAFAITAKVVTEDVLKRYEQEIMDFGGTSIMFTIIATLAMLNLLSLIGGLINIIFLDFGALQHLIYQIILCGLMILVNLPIHEALFIRRDKGCLPVSVMFKSTVFASLAFLMPYT